MALNTTLAQVLQAPTQDQIYQDILTRLQNNGFPTTDWVEGGPEKTMVQSFATALLDYAASSLPFIAGGGLVDYASGAWLTLLAQEGYNLTRNPATNTIGSIVLSCNATNGPYTIVPGQLWFVAASGLRYTNTSGGALNSNGTLTVTVQSENPNNSAVGLNYVDAANTITSMATPLPGVTCNNPAGTYSAVTKAGSGTGTLTLTGAPGIPHAVSVRIDVAGQSGVASWSYSVDGGAYVSAGAVATLNNVAGTGINITLTNGAGTPSFNLGDVLSFTTPGTWISIQGTDQESDVALQSRCKNRWPSLSLVPTLGLYDLMARTASSQVTQTLVVTDGTINNKVNIYVAGQGGVLPAATLTIVQNYVNPRVPLTDFPVVLSPTPVTITLAGVTITVKLASLTTAQVTIQAALATYFTGIGLNGTARLSSIIDIIMNVLGVVDVSETTMTLNGVAANLVLPTVPGQVQVGVWSQLVANAFVWQTV